MVKLKPLVKWPGGKSKEIKYFESCFPASFDRYVEPFFGGGSVFFYLKPQNALLNDISADLISFYRYIQSENIVFKSYIYKIANFWDNLDLTEFEQIFGYFKSYLKSEHNSLG